MWFSDPDTEPKIGSESVFTEPLSRYVLTLRIGLRSRVRTPAGQMLNRNANTEEGSAAGSPSDPTLDVAP